MGKQSDKPQKVSISDPVNLMEGEKVVTFYRVTTVFLNKEKGQHQLSIHHRFSDFRDMHSQIEEYYSRDPIAKKLPSPPPKAISLFGFGVDHTNPEFIENRVALLNEYMNGMRSISGVACNDIFLAFLGFFNDGKECSIATKKDPMIVLNELDKSIKGGFRCQLDSFKKGPGDEKGPIEITELIMPKDLIVRVNCENVEGMKYKNVCKLCKPTKGEFLIIWFSGQHSYAPVKDLPSESSIKTRSSKKHRKHDVSDDDDEDDDVDNDDSDEDEGPKHKKSHKKNKKLLSDDDDDDMNSDDDKKKKPHKLNDKKSSKKHVSDEDEDDDDDDYKKKKSSHKLNDKKGKKHSKYDDDDDDDEDLSDDYDKKKKSSHKIIHKKGKDIEDDDDDDDYDDDKKHKHHKKEEKSKKIEKVDKKKKDVAPPPPPPSSNNNTSLPESDKKKIENTPEKVSDIAIEEDENLVV